MSGGRVAVAAVVVLALAVLALPLGAAGAGAINPTPDSSIACLTGPVAPGADTGVGGETLDQEQISNAQIIYVVGVSLGVPVRGEVIAIATAMQESRLRNLSGGDADSIGLFQQRGAWGSASQRMDPVQSSQMFYEGGHGGQPGLLDIPNWQVLPLTDAAQAVQRSGFPDAYAQWEPIATALAGTFAGTADACVGDDSPAIPGDITTTLPAGFVVPPGTPLSVAVAISWAAAQLGTPYHFGGSCTASHSGDPSKECDCSSLVQQAYRAAGIGLPRTTSEQINVGTPIYNSAALRAGDLIFLPHHVGLYIGYGLVLHAPHTGDVVKISQVQGYWLSNVTGIRRIVT